MVEPVYRNDNCSVAYQLNWSLSIFQNDPAKDVRQAIENLKPVWESDGIHVLDISQSSPQITQFFLSSRPTLIPSDIIRLIKGRLQHALRESSPIRLRRNYQLNSVGSATSVVLDRYIQHQTTKHPMAQARVQSMFEQLQFHDESVDLVLPRINSHGKFVYALQIVLETAEGWRDVRRVVLEKYVQVIQTSCEKHHLRLSRVGILANHIHLLLGAEVTMAPQPIALSLLNNLAYSQQMKPIFKFGFYVGTFGPYDRGAIWNSIRNAR